jgi:lipocalin
VYLSQDYKYAIVYGGSPKYIWILARENKIANDKLKELLMGIKGFGLDETTLLLQQ